MSVAIAGGGPGGLLLGYLLARAGIDVTVLEARSDFDRDFRGDSLHPYTLELLDRLGLAGDLLELDHFKARSFRFHTPAGGYSCADYDRLRTPFGYVALMPQVRFLDFLAERANALPTFRLRTNAKVTGLLEADGAVTGVRFRGGELETSLVIGADGRFSTVRRLAGLEARPLGATTDLLWFRLPRSPGDPPDADLDLYFGRDAYVGVLGGVRDWQVGYSIEKGAYPALRERGVEPIRAFVRERVPWLADRAHLLTDFSQTTLLSVDISRVERWHRPGLLLLGDAAHVISPVGGNGILMAVQDAVAATNRLVPALRRGDVTDEDLAAVQADRIRAIERVQADQVRVEKRAAAARARGRGTAPPALLKLLFAIPALRTRGARGNAYGPFPPQLDESLFAS
ncbi:2-polyprenyl-6-methoxyphenol hydroxylase-like FAD-dependent oxidoreductase [Amycolatopsis lexingtonensis]|uniref:2-polyprenyl-6-methoxyphenol hydroxylase-like FAD-dependent oxidoreductase n=1 Tax=Amycolatopsis lexingtonensis TaxID=218822 RepID=A0ABR9HUX7_9PSEU|nr:FAD-dependent oxidoreductase [Amycolatopsis lexingtonensis]MBE1494527.1 2-polyprenyl-6-methoxyphenol hydroxylase-like FAD-dependent oxidoreductase [Amycolatopsis lexingtonensis]